MLHIQGENAVGGKLTEIDIFSNPDDIKIQVSDGGFIVTLQLHQDHISSPLSAKHYWIGCQTITVNVSSNAFTPDDMAEANWAKTSAAFSKIAFQSLNRLIDYCRYELGYPFMRHANVSNVESIDWLDEVGTVLKTEGSFQIMDFFPGVPGTIKSLGSQFLTPHHKELLTRVVASGATPTVQQELLAFARDSIYEGHVLKAILLLAIASEVAIKTTFFQEDTLASVAFDYLEENRRVEVTSIELIGKVAKRSFGVSFSEHNAKAAAHIDHLFRCRNKVAHRARAEYKDDKGVLHTVNEATLYSWWEAVTTLLDWLAARRSERTRG